MNDGRKSIVSFLLGNWQPNPSKTTPLRFPLLTTVENGCEIVPLTKFNFHPNAS